MALTLVATYVVAVLFLVGLVVLKEDERAGHPAFEDWKAKYKIVYANSLENGYRQAIFL